MSDSCEGAFGGGKLEGKAARKHHRRSTRVRSRQERASRPRLTILNVSSQAEQAGETGQAGRGFLPGLTARVSLRCATRVTRWWSASWRHTTTRW